MRIVSSDKFEYLGFSGGLFIFKDLRFGEVTAVKECKFIHNGYVIMAFNREHLPVFEYSYATAARILSHEVPPLSDLPFVVSMPQRFGDGKTLSKASGHSQGWT